MKNHNINKLSEALATELISIVEDSYRQSKALNANLVLDRNKIIDFYNFYFQVAYNLGRLDNATDSLKGNVLDKKV